jgi:hypothetical protein
MPTDANILTFKQWNNFAKLSFRFSPDYLSFDIASSGSRRTGFNTRYEALPGSFYYKTLRPRYLLIMFFLFMGGALTLAELVFDVPEPSAILNLRPVIFFSAYTAVLCAAGFALRGILRKDYTVLATPGGNILIAKRGAHDAIIEQLQKRRMAALAKLVVIDPAQSPWKEVKKFKWLRDEGVISDGEYQAYSQTILHPMRQGTTEVTNSVVH